MFFFFFFSSRRRHTRWTGDWSSDVCSSDLAAGGPIGRTPPGGIAPGGVAPGGVAPAPNPPCLGDRKSTRLNSSHPSISYAVFCLKKKKKTGHENYITAKNIDQLFHSQLHQAH